MPLKDKEARRKYHREYQERRKSELQKNRKRYYQKHRPERDNKTAEYRKTHPWVSFYDNARARCVNPKHPSFKHYGLKGIKFLLSVEEVKELWFRDKAHEMNKPSLDRERAEGNYDFDNCSFIELKLNVGKKVQNY